MKNKCITCGDETNGFMVSVGDVLKSTKDTKPICYKCIDGYLDDHEIDAVLVYSVGTKGKWEGRKFFDYAVILDMDHKNLFALAHRLRGSWKKHWCDARVWYDTQRQEEITNIVQKYLNRSVKDPVTSKQITAVQALITSSNNSQLKAILYKKYNVKSTKELTKDQASEAIDLLKKGLLV